MQVRLVETKVIVGQETFESWIDFHVVVKINCVDIATTIVNGSFQLTYRKEKTIIKCFADKK